VQGGIVLDYLNELQPLKSAFGLRGSRKKKNKVKLKGKFTPKQATKDQRGSRGIDLLVL
jgi:hypothetical protein